MRPLTTALLNALVFAVGLAAAGCDTRALVELDPGTRSVAADVAGDDAGLSDTAVSDAGEGDAAADVGTDIVAETDTVAEDVSDGGDSGAGDSGPGDSTDTRLDAQADADNDTGLDAAPDAPADADADLFDPAAPTFVGSPCRNDADCDLDDPVCLLDEYSGGMCAEPCTLFCPDRDGFPTTFCTADANTGDPHCHSRCDYGAFPVTGCRDNYVCRVVPRAGEPSTEVGACVPDDGTTPELPECIQWLVDNNVPFERTTYAPRHPEGNDVLLCTVDEPVRLQSPVAGVSFRYYYDDPGEYRSMLMSCNLARSITKMAQTLSDEYDIVEVVHIGTTVCRFIAGSSSLSQHSYGRAIDLRTFVRDDGWSADVYDDWEHDTTTFESDEAAFLYEIAYGWHDAGIFNTILTPNYNSAHDNHFHVDLKPGADFIKNGCDCLIDAPADYAPLGD